MEQTRKQSYSVATLIQKSWRILIALLIATILIGGGLVAYKFYINNKELKGITALEKFQEEYESIINTYDINIQEVEVDKEKIELLIADLIEFIEMHKGTFSAQDASYRIGILYTLLQNFEEAQKYFTHALDIYESYLQPKIMANLASVLENQNNFTLAKEYLYNIQYNYPNSVEYPHALFSLGRISEILDKEEGTNTAQGVYLTLVEDEKWEDSPWVQVSKSRLAWLGYYTLESTTEYEDSAIGDSPNESTSQ